MRILIIDEDETSVPHVVEELAQYQHDVRQIANWKDAVDAVHTFRPEAIVLDLMIPPIDLPVAECGGGFSTGLYLYRHILHDVANGIPFILYSAAHPKSEIVIQTCEELRAYPEFRGLLTKGCDAEEITRLLESYPSRKI